MARLSSVNDPKEWLTPVNASASGRILNIAVLAHVDAGKTTTVEQMLYVCGMTKAAGSVEAKNTKTDWLPIERERGISVRNASISLTYGGTRINLIDTPGHFDFTGEAERALIAVDCAVLVISAAEGVQPQTGIFWKALRRKGAPTILFVNKIDRAGCDIPAVLEDIRRELTPDFIALNSARNEGSRACGLAGREFTENDVFTLGEFDPLMADAFLNGKDCGREAVARSLRAQTAACRAFPLLFGAAALGLGVRELLDAIVAYLPAAPLSEAGELSGKIYKIEHDKALGKVAHARIFTGCIKNRDLVVISRENGETFSQKVTQIRSVQGEKSEDAGVVRGGEISALCGLSEARMGDWLGAPLRDKSYTSTMPLFSARVSSPDGRLAELYRAARELADEDPLLDLYWNREERELVVNIMGDIQLDVLSYLLRERYGLEAEFSAPTVIYKETPSKKGRGFAAYTMPKPCWAVVELEFDPLPRGSGVRFASTVNNSVMFPRYQHHVEVSTAEALKQGLFGWEVTDLSVTLVGGEHHLIHTHPLDFFVATPMAVMDALEKCGSTLLEPMRTLRIAADEVHLTGVIGDIVNMKGEFGTPIVKDGKFEMEALVPAAASADYPVVLAAKTAGRARLTAGFGGYRECAATAVAKRRGVDPRDRAKWILYKRNALAGE
ncbi:MAG: TetM/TetW/TetO/TetS family tetracycline resistance ribosomal protection protein [Firmicutes bacterium]|nr:TetM/TetW/TetO/TetS family tetracycline resistance ribosomal protection protein [Bacillota bacterium]